MASKINGTQLDFKPWENNVLTHNQNILNQFQKNLVSYERKYKLNKKFQLPKISQNISERKYIPKTAEQMLFVRYIQHQKLKTLHQSLELVKQIRQAKQKQEQKRVQSVLSERQISNQPTKLRATKNNLEQLLIKRQDQQQITKRKSQLKHKQMFIHRNVGRENLRQVIRKIDSKQNILPLSSRRYEHNHKDISDVTWLLINYKQSNTVQGRLKKKELHQLIFGGKNKI